MTDNGSSRIITPGQHRTVADLSSRDRSQLMDETLMTVHELLLQVAGMGQAILALKREQDADRAFLNALKSEVSNAWQHTTNAPRFSSFLARFRWLLTGR